MSVPKGKDTTFLIGDAQYKTAEFSEIEQLSHLFTNDKGPEIVHAWTPREIVRNYCNQLRELYDFNLFIHLEDNEEHLTTKFLLKPLESFFADEEMEVPENLSHPVKYRDFLAVADGITVIVDNLKEFVPKHIPCLTLWPGVDTKTFFPQKPDYALAAKISLPLNSAVFCYTGNVHTANANEVRSLYLAVAMLNREGLPTTLIRTGKDFCDFLGADRTWVDRYCIELGYVERHLIPSLLALADILIQPGKTDDFNDYRFPSKLPEFLAMGKPVVMPSTNIGKLMEHMKNAMVLPVVDALSIIDATRLIINDDLLCARLSDGALAFAEENLSWRKNSEKLQNFYESV
ncbi:MAG: glycosyltransferase family 4 protein [Cyanothece sp. SIO1E1]|nr:glycosyltransferase family 4 protein [Cyanothece sp. SIO1E1]